VRTVHALPDLSRSLARTHALLEVADGLLWVTDLGSANGSAITDRDGVSQPLVAGLRTAAAVGWTVRLGGRSFEVHPARVTATAGRTTDGR
jgi:pSer/pThr/pTyr-binding forkhead associated (FHA) protein